MADYAYAEEAPLVFKDSFDEATDEYMTWRADQATDSSGNLIGTYDSSTDQMDPAIANDYELLLKNNIDSMGNDDLASYVKQALAEKSTESTPAEIPTTGNNGKSEGLLSSVTKMLGGDSKIAAALVQGGFGMLSGASQGKMLENKYKIEKQRRDEEWARKDANSYAGTLKRKSYGLLGSAAK